MISVSKKRALGSIQNLALLGIALLVLVVARDIAHSFIKNYSFYLSESLLFSTFWLIFIPLTLICKRPAQKSSKIILAVLLSVLHLCAFSFFVFVISTLFFDDSFEFFRTLMNTTSKYGIVCVLFYCFCSFLFVNKNPVLEKSTTKNEDKIKVNHKGQVIILDCNDIIYVKSDKPYVALITKDKRYLYTCTLKTFLQKHATTNFIQVHKSVIVNSEHIVSYKSRKNGDYDLSLTHDYFVRASRNYNQNFKSFFKSISLE